jgi:UDP-N-acetylglucosamine--N-acetylmuramyl-(pentapeptide) pyrophosphoryl-undecaprenol N-acetylglucosamine transferase
MKFIFTCGGTAGHINPAVSAAQRLRELMPDSHILFIGSEGNMEMELVPKEGYEITAIKVGSLHRSLKPKDIFHNIKAAAWLISSIKKAGEIIKDFKPDAVLGTGGYVCYPVIRAAAAHNIPTLLHEANVTPGLTTRMLEKYADILMVGFESSKSFYKHPERIVYTGMPVRAGFRNWSPLEAKHSLGLEGKPVVMSFWGSLGASHMNELTAELIALNERDNAFYHIHATGGGDEGLKKMRSRISALGVKELKCTDLRPYIYDQPKVMAAADLVICRAGAATLGELTAIGKPAVLIPSLIKNIHQEDNARVLEKQGGAVLIKEPDCSSKLLFDTAKSILSDAQKQRSMSSAMLSLSRPDAVDAIVKEILNVVKN